MQRTAAIAALDPAVRMALTPTGVVQNNCFEKTLLYNCPFQIDVSIPYSPSDVKMFFEIYSEKSVEKQSFWEQKIKKCRNQETSDKNNGRLTVG